MKNKIIIWSLRIFLAAVFIFSAYTKIISPGLIEIIIVDQGFAASRETAALYVRLLIGLELGLGLLFLQPFYLKRYVVPLSLLFLLGFTTYLFYTGFILGESGNCGCFGEMLKFSPVESIIKNVFLMIPALLLLFLIKEERKNIFPLIGLLVIAVGFVLLAAPIKTNKDFKFKQYTNFIGAGRVDLSEGNKLLAVFNTECDHCQETAREFAKLQSNSKYPQTYVLFFSEGNISVDSFKTITKSNFPYAEIKVREFFDLIGQAPPRIYWLQNGSIKEIWDEKFVEKLKKNFP